MPPYVKVGGKVVVLTRVLPDEVNKGYHNSGDYRIVEVNGQPINNLKDLVRIVEGSREPFVSFTDRWGASVVLDCKDVEARKREILDKYRIEKESLS